MKALLTIPPHLTRITTLPCDLSLQYMFQIVAIFRTLIIHKAV